MKAILSAATTILLCAVALPRAHAQGFNSGSDGSSGPMNITTNTTLDLPTNGIFNCTTITVDQGATLRFRGNPLNTPVYLRATGDVLINGVIDVSGNASPGNFVGGQSGPGGFDGGSGGFAAGNEALSGGAGQVREAGFQGTRVQEAPVPQAAAGMAHNLDSGWMRETGRPMAHRCSFR